MPVVKDCRTATRPVDRILNTKRCDNAKVLKKIARVVARESRCFPAAEVDAAKQLAAMLQRNHRNAFGAIGMRANNLVVARGE